MPLSQTVFPEEECHVKAQFLDWYAVGNHLPGIDVFSTPGKYLLYLSVVSGSAGSGDLVADQRKNQALAVTRSPPRYGWREPPVFFYA